MSYKLKISDGAEKDIKNALSYYKSEVSIAVAQNFLVDFKERLKRAMWSKIVGGN